MNTEMLLSSAVIAAILSGIISFFISKRQANLQYITSERKEWREKIRIIASQINGAGYKKTLKLLTELKVRINAFGNKDIKVSYSSDSHIWCLINEIEEKELKGKDLKLKQKQMVEYLSLLLKFDWERSKKEVQGDMYNVISLLLFVISGIYFVVSVFYLKVKNIEAYIFVSICIIYFLMIVIVYSVFMFEIKVICQIILSGTVITNPQNYKRKKLIICYIIVLVGIIGSMLGYLYILDQFLETVSCGENNLIIMLVSFYIYMLAVLLLYWTQTTNMDKIYNYNNSINKIRIKYEKDR